MKKITLIILLLAFSNFLLIAQNKEVIDKMIEEVNYLASDKLEGRETGTASERLAAKYIRDKFRKSNALPKGTDGYFQYFEATIKSQPHSDVVEKKINGINVIGYLDNTQQETVIIGAHYDHLGYGHSGSLHDGDKEIHNGADDNASGTAGLLTLAENYAGTRPRRGLLFIAFAGEELGLLGSRYYTEHPTYPLKRTNAMINLDMIGRSDGDLLIGGVGTSVYFKGILDELQGSSSLHFTYSDSLQGSSDHLSFLAQKIPVLFFFSGLHSDYHRPSDDWERIDLVRTEEILGIVSGTLGRLMTLDGALEYVDITVDQQQKPIAGRRDRPRFGVFPDMSWDLGGVRFNEIVNGAPAQKAGVRAGDILIRFDRQEIENLNRFLRILQTKTPGDEVVIVLLREAKIVQTTVHLDARD